MKTKKTTNTKRIASALTCTSLTDYQAQRMYDAFFELFKAEKNKKTLRVIKGGRSC